VPSSASSLARAFDVLGLFSLATPALSAEEMAARLGYTRSTAYRYLKELSEAGLLAPGSDGRYSLGPRIVELERLLVMTDPLFLAGQEVLPGVDVPNTALLLHALYADKVLCVYKHGPDVIEHEGTRITLRRARGVPLPLYKGAASLAILANLPTPRVQQVYLQYATEIGAAGLGADWKAFRAALLAMRRAGYAVSQSQITPLIRGIAVPVYSASDGKLVGSLARATGAGPLSATEERTQGDELTAIARAVGAEYAKCISRRDA